MSLLANIEVTFSVPPELSILLIKKHTVFIKNHLDYLCKNFLIVCHGRNNFKVAMATILISGLVLNMA